MKNAARMALALGLLAVMPVRAQPPETSCTTCHADTSSFDEEDTAKVGGWRDGVHAAVGVSCHDCHGGNPDLALADDEDAAMDPLDPVHPFREAPAMADVPAFCGRCHSSPRYMKKFRPDARIDQEAEYWTSHHGEALARGDRRVAVCTSCHGVHGIRRADDPRSPVYPTQVAETCGSCHADPKRMAATLGPDGKPIPVDQLARWRSSVHAKALLEKGDLFAPTCNDCHGNHGATPPGLESVVFVCGRCHGREADLLRASPKSAGFTEHDEMLLDEETGNCAECHEAPEPAAALSGLTRLGQCVACHSNHSIGRPTTALLANLPKTPCAMCHGVAGVVPGAEEREPASTVARFREQRDRLLSEAGELGLTGEERFDWLVDQLLQLPFHTRLVQRDGEEQRVLRAEFGRLFEKFRVGKTYNTFTDPASGEQRRARVRRCTDCHAPAEAGDTSGGRYVAGEMMSRMQRLETAIARAERTLLAAKRGGVEVGEAETDLSEAVDSQIKLQVLVHSFSVKEGSPFPATFDEAMEHAHAAAAASQQAIRELAVRRRGLYVTLFFVTLVLIGLALTIRRLSARGASVAGPVGSGQI